MPELLTIGPVHELTADVIYALPARAVFLQSTAVIQTSLALTTTSFANVAASTTGVQTAAAFVRCTTSGGTRISLKPG